jgi:hypothetical protein
MGVPNLNNIIIIFLYVDWQRIGTKYLFFKTYAGRAAGVLRTKHVLLHGTMTAK